MLLPESGSWEGECWLAGRCGCGFGFVNSAGIGPRLGNGPNVLRRHGNGKMSQEAPKIVANICSFMLP